MFFGGGQERSYRPGTENTGMIAGLGEACRLVVENLQTYEKHMQEVRQVSSLNFLNDYVRNHIGMKIFT